MNVFSEKYTFCGGVHKTINVRAQLFLWFLRHSGISHVFAPDHTLHESHSLPLILCPSPLSFWILYLNQIFLESIPDYT